MMNDKVSTVDKFQIIIRELFCKENGYLLNAEKIFSNTNNYIGNRLNSAFLIGLSGKGNSRYSDAIELLNSFLVTHEYGQVAGFLLNCIDDIQTEIAIIADKDKNFSNSIIQLESYLKKNPSTDSQEFNDKVWSLFFPEGVGVLKNHKLLANQLREKRIVRQPLELILEISDDSLISSWNMIILNTHP